MKASLFLLSSLGIMGAYAGTCTIGLEWDAELEPNPKGSKEDGSTYGFIIGPNKKQTNEPTNNNGPNGEVQAMGDFAGGPKWTIHGSGTSFQVDDCTALFKGQTKTLKSGCKTYKGAGPFTGKAGCTCDFDC